MCAKGPRKAYGEAERPPIDKHRKAERKERRRRRRRHESSGRSARILGERGDAACVISVAGRRSDVRRSRFQRDARAHACVPTHRRAHGAARPSCLVKKKKKKHTHTAESSSDVSPKRRGWKGRGSPCPRCCREKSAPGFSDSSMCDRTRGATPEVPGISLNTARTDRRCCATARCARNSQTQ